MLGCPGDKWGGTGVVMVKLPVHISAYDQAWVKLGCGELSSVSTVTAEAACSEQPTQLAELFPSKNSPPAGFQPQGPALDPDSSNPKEAILEMATWTGDPAKVGLGSPVAGYSLLGHLVVFPEARAVTEPGGLLCCLLAGPCRARCCGSPGQPRSAEGPE